MLKFIFLVLALLTILLNILITYNLIRDKKYSRARYLSKKEIVSFDLTQYAANEEAAMTEVLETEVMMPSIKEKR